MGRWKSWSEGLQGSPEEIELQSPDLLGGKRKMVMYLPPGYHEASGPCGLLLVFDWEFNRCMICRPHLVDRPSLQQERFAPWWWPISEA